MSYASVTQSLLHTPSKEIGVCFTMDVRRADAHLAAPLCAAPSAIYPRARFIGAVPSERRCRRFSVPPEGTGCSKKIPVSGHRDS